MAGAKKEKQRAEKEQHKRSVAENEKHRANNLLTKRANMIDLVVIRKELVLFYKFLEKFVAKLKETEYVAMQQKEPAELQKIPFIAPNLAEELTQLDSMTDLQIYSSALLQYAVHFDLNISAHTYNLNNAPTELFIGRNDKMILTPDSVFNLVELYTYEQSKALRELAIAKPASAVETTVINYLKNMQKLTSRLNEQIDYEVINFILEKNKDTTNSAKCKYNESIKYYTNISIAKKTLTKLTHDKSGFIDDMVDSAAHEIKLAKSENTELEDDLDAEDLSPEEYIAKNKNMLQTITGKMTNKIGNNIIDGKVNDKQFINIANNVIAKMQKAGGNMKSISGMKKLKNIDINKMKEMRDKCGGDFSKMFDMDGMFGKIMDDIKDLKDLGISK